MVVVLDVIVLTNSAPMTVFLLNGLFWYFLPLCEASDMLLRGCSPGYMHNNSRMAVVAELSETVCFPELSVKLAASAGIIPNF